MTRAVVASGGEITPLGPVEISGMVGGVTARPPSARFYSSTGKER